jgi:DNA-binding CsgD family transcriptional regulator
VPLAGFQAWALEQLEALIAFDSACWGTAAAHAPVMHEVHLHNCEPGIVEAYSPYMDQDVFRAALIARPGITVNLSDLTTRAGHVRTPLYREFARRFKVEWSLGTLLIEATSSVCEFLTLWRHDPRRPFSETERQIKELLMPHLVEAHRAVRLRHFLRTPEDWSHEWALADARGFLREASPAFIARLRALWSDWNGGDLPDPLASCARDGLGCVVRNVRFDVTPCGQLRYVVAKSSGALGRLSAREGEISTRYARGETHSKIAVSLSLSPATVRNHIARCFKKLGVNNKAELVRRLTGRLTGQF